jgi:hypothetical protein
MCVSRSTQRYLKRTTPVARTFLSELALPGQVRSLTPKVWVFSFLYAVISGLVIQLLVLPYVFPQLHAGEGLIAGRDWVGFHQQALAQAHQIFQVGWEAFALRPDGDNAIIGVASFFYVVFAPHPWALLPLSALMFATGGVALFSILKRLGLADKEAIVAFLPYAFFPSALLQYGQIHKDVFCTSGVFIILWSWVSLLGKSRKLREIVPLIAVSACALVLVSVFRPYFMYPFLGLCTILLLWHIAESGWRLGRHLIRRENIEVRRSLIFSLQSIAILLVLFATVYETSKNYLDIRMQPLTASDMRPGMGWPKFTWKSNENVRSADAARIYAEGAQIDLAMQIKAIEECRPVVILRGDAFVENAINRVFLKIAVARAGFTSSGGTTAASNIDKGIDFCKNEDLIRYIPRALQIAFFAPFPSTWLATEKRNSSSIEIYISTLEMIYCYVAYLGLIYWLISYRRWSVALVVPVAFALGLTLLLGLTVANVGTLYRMRFPFVMIFVGIGMAGLLRVLSFARLRSIQAAPTKATGHCAPIANAKP